MTVGAIEICNLNRFKGTYKHEKIKIQNRENVRLFYEYRWWKMARWIHKVSIVKRKADICFDKCNRKKYKPVSNDQYNFLNTLCNSWVFYIDTFSILW